jgi:hypothetical protein
MAAFASNFMNCCKGFMIFKLTIELLQELYEIKLIIELLQGLQDDSKA